MSTSSHQRCSEWLDSLPESTPAPDAPPLPPADPPAASPRDSFFDPRDIVNPLKRKRSRSMDDLEQTPRAKRPPPDDDDANQSPSKKSCASTTSSIARQAQDLKNTGQYHDSFLDTLLEQDDLPQHARDLLMSLDSVRRGENALPRSLEAELKDIAAKRRRTIRDWEYIGDTSAGDADPTWREVDSIVQEAKRCGLRADFEAGWNSGVHGPLLLLATSLSRHSAIQAINLTNSTLLTRLKDATAVSRAKMVDFGLYLDGDSIPALASAFIDLEKGEQEVKTWNHTGSTQISTKPLVVSVETKREGEGNEKANLQLGTWTFAHFRRLLEVRTLQISQKEEERVIYLPLLKVLGPTWTFSLAQCRYGLNDHKGDTRDVTIFGQYILGDVTNHFECFRVLRALLIIMSWVHDHYLPWFEKWVTGQT